MPSKMYAMVSSLIPSEKCVQIRSLADPKSPSDKDKVVQFLPACFYHVIKSSKFISYHKP